MVPLMALASNSSTLTVKVTVVKQPPCIINDSRPIEVDFGEVLTTQVDGNNYLMPVNYTISCTGTEDKGMNIQVSGTPANFDSRVLQTTSAGLGIALKTDVGVGGKLFPIDINQWFSGYHPNNPWRFWAVPVKQNDVALRGGAFTAGATMRVAYP
ncbi:fimbrial protein [Enterobacter cloacae complex sp. P32C]|nr:fimbrial protein [Enterobacter cloacae complex sp. P32C]